MIVIAQKISHSKPAKHVFAGVLACAILMTTTGKTKTTKTTE